MDTHTPIEPTLLPSTIRTFLAAHAAREADAAVRTFTTSPVVVDEGRTHRGAEDVLAFLRTGGGQYTYTTELVGAERVDDTHWVAINRLAGDFPGGVAELRYTFVLAGDLIEELVIAP